MTHEEDMDWGEMAKDKNADPEVRVLAAAVHTVEQHNKRDDFMRQLVADLGADTIDQVMEHLVSAGRATWRRKPEVFIGGRRYSGAIGATWAGHKWLEAAVEAAQEEEREAAQAKVKGRVAAASQWLRSAAETVTAVKTLLGFLMLVAAVVFFWFQGCGP